MAWGPTRRKERYLSKIPMADEIWCQAFPSGPGSTSPVPHRIEDQGDHFSSRSEVWSSFAHIADFCILVGLGDPMHRATRT